MRAIAHKKVWIAQEQSPSAVLNQSKPSDLRSQGFRCQDRQIFPSGIGDASRLLSSSAPLE
jgi:hypothetical protein